MSLVRGRLGAGAAVLLALARCMAGPAVAGASEAPPEGRRDHLTDLPESLCASVDTRRPPRRRGAGTSAATWAPGSSREKGGLQRRLRATPGHEG
jgi:hypothetical protein